MDKKILRTITKVGDLFTNKNVLKQGTNMRIQSQSFKISYQVSTMAIMKNEE